MQTPLSRPGDQLGIVIPDLGPAARPGLSKASSRSCTIGMTSTLEL